MIHLGLTDKEVEASRMANGSNELSPIAVQGFWTKLKNNFKDPIIYILLVALVVILVLSFFSLTEWFEALAIAAAVLLATGISTFSEHKNESSFQKLQEEASKIKNKVYRNGEIRDVHISEIVKGDEVLLQAGDVIPADGIIIQGEVKVNQASLTGESKAVAKIALEKGVEYDPTDLSNKYGILRGTMIEDGEAVMKVEVVGDKTFYGNLSKELSLSHDRLSPLQVKLKDLADLISKFGYIAAVFIFLVFMFQKAVILNDFEMDRIMSYFNNWEVLLTDGVHAIVLAIIILVAAVPEGLPTMIAIVLSLNMQKMLREKVLVRKLLGIETAGSLSILFTDKTGTLTYGKLQPKYFISGSGETFESYDEIPRELREYLKIAIVGNSASHRNKDNEIIGGNFSERALLSYIDPSDDISLIDQSEIVHKIYFNSNRKFSATELKFPRPLEAVEEDQVVLIKGAPEILMKNVNSSISESGIIEPIKDKADLAKHLDKLADSGIRLLGIALSTETLNHEDEIAGDMILVGFIGLQDTIRETTESSVKLVKQAGVQVVMMTGDRKGTAISIAKEAGILENEQQVVLESSDLKKMSDEEIAEILPNLRVVARSLPSDKSRLVRISKALGKVIGMTGDGVNDSPALKHSDVGIAMGSGSEVAKEAGDIVILDDNFNSISNAIRYGRTIFNSIRKFITFQLTVNVAAVSISMLGPVINVDFPLTIIQLLWINLIMDTLGAIALGGEPALRRYMKDKPIKREENILSKSMISTILVNGLFITFFSVAFLKLPFFADLFARGTALDHKVFMTVFFNIFIFQVLFNLLNVRSIRINFLEHIQENRRFLYIVFMIIIIQVLLTTIGGEVLRTVPLTWNEWLLVILFSLIIIPVDIIHKLIAFRKVSLSN